MKKFYDEKRISRGNIMVIGEDPYKTAEEKIDYDQFYRDWKDWLDKHEKKGDNPLENSM